MDYQTKKLLSKLQEISEQELTLNVLKPLFHALRYERVDYHGGQNEGGKDIICWTTDELGDTELIVAQVKKYKPTARAADKQSFSGIVTQLQQAAEKKVPNLDGQQYFPSKLFFITPFEIDTRPLQTRFEAYEALKSRRVKIIDGVNLVNLLKKHVPHIVREYIGNAYLNQEYFLNHLNNNDLLNALNTATKSDSIMVYCDLEFGIGKITSKVFFSLSFISDTKDYKLSPEEWSDFKARCYLAEKEFGISLVSPTYDEIEQSYDREREVYLKAIRSKTRKLKETINEPVYKFKFDGSPLVKALKQAQDSIKKQGNDIRVNNDIKRLKGYLEKCSKLFGTIDTILANTNISTAVVLQNEQKYCSTNAMPKFNISIHSVFDTGMDIAVFADAGAGKTTSLQAYAKRKLENPNESELYLFIPLARSITALEKKVPSHQTIHEVDKLELALLHYLQSIGFDITITSFLQELNSKKIIFLLDGLDEAIKRASWLFDAIPRLKLRYPKSQIIISSRMSEEYLSKIPFLGITLLPFTEEQRSYFIQSWFKETGSNKADQIINHLSKHNELADIIRNPLLATIICVLSENDVPLPNNEVRLYEERMRLLLGHYDLHKRVSRIKSHQSDLELVARKLAYFLHRSATRSAEPEQLKAVAISELKSVLGKKKVELAIQELIDTCNVLVPMTDEGQLGFGHLRYQEYLAACELSHNRGISILPLLHQNWWRGALVLFAQMTDNIEFLIEEAVISSKISEVYETLDAMLSVRSTQDKIYLGQLIKKHASLDAYDADFKQAQEIMIDDILDLDIRY